MFGGGNYGGRPDLLSSAVTSAVPDNGDLHLYQTVAVSLLGGQTGYAAARTLCRKTGHKYTLIQQSGSKRSASLLIVS
jgi:hypothetical protein